MTTETEEATDMAWCDLVDETLIPAAHVGDYDQLERWFDEIPTDQRAEVLEHLHAAAKELTEAADYAWRRWRTWQTHEADEMFVVPAEATWLDAPPSRGPGPNA